MSLLFGWLDGWLVGWMVDWLVGLSVCGLLLWSGCANTPKGNFTCNISPAHLYATGAVMYTALLASLYEGLSIRWSVCLSIHWSVRPSIHPSVGPSHVFFLAEFNWKWHRNHGKLLFN